MLEKHEKGKDNTLTAYLGSFVELKDGIEDETKAAGRTIPSNTPPIRASGSSSWRNEKHGS